MNAMDSIFLPRFTIGENAFDAFHDEMGRYGKKVAVIHGERAWKAAREYVVPALEKAGLTITTEWLYGHDATHENADKISNDPAVQEADAPCSRRWKMYRYSKAGCRSPWKTGIYRSFHCV